MDKIKQPFTLGVWKVKPGNEDTFISEWRAFAHWTAEHQAGALRAALLQDSDRPEQFISFGPWENTEAIKAWRERPEFTAFVSKARQLCDEFEPHSLMLVASSEY